MFVAVYPPMNVIEALLESLDALELPPHRLVRPDQIHLTLLFLGQLPSAELDATLETVQRATAGFAPFILAPSRLITLPERHAARLVAAEAEAPPTLLELHRRLASRLARRPRKRPSDRFRPHLTLCRFRSPRRMPPLNQPVSVEPFEVRSIELMKSDLTPKGAIHEQVVSCTLETQKPREET